MLTLVVGAVTTVVGAIIGYRIRWREFRRDQRLKVYGEFVSAFLVVAHLGALAVSVYTQIDEDFYNPRHDKARLDLTTRWTDAFRAFEDATARLRLIASKGVRRGSENLENFLATNVLAIPPFTREMDTTNGEKRRRSVQVRLTSRLRNSPESLSTKLRATSSRLENDDAAETLLPDFLTDPAGMVSTQWMASD